MKKLDYYIGQIVSGQIAGSSGYVPETSSAQDVWAERVIRYAKALIAMQEKIAKTETENEAWIQDNDVTVH